MSTASSVGIRKGQIVPFVGKLNPEVPQGNDSKFYTVDTLGSEKTQNRSCFELFEIIQTHAQEISFKDAALQAVIGKDLIEDSLGRIQVIFSEVSTRVVTHANRLFGSTFGGPLPYEFIQWAIRWSGENQRALTICHAFASAAYQVPRLRSNALDTGIIDSQAATIVRPLMDIKAEIMRQHFGLEVQGEVNPNELDALLAGATLLNPSPAATEERRESQAANAARLEASLPQQSTQRPTQERSELAREGKDVWTWAPTQTDWDVFAAIAKARETTAVRNVPLQPYPFSTTSIGPNTTSSASGPVNVSNTLTNA